MIPYALLYKLGFAPWERRNVEQTWQAMLDGPDAPPPGRALDIGCGSGRDAVHLAKRGWQVTGVEFDDKALAKAKQRAAEEGVEVQWLGGDVSELGQLGLEPGYSLVYDFGCIHGLPDAARRGAASGLTELAAPGATLLLLAFRAKRRMVLPRGMDKEHVIDLLGEGWELQHAQPVTQEDIPPPVRRAKPTLYRLTRREPATTAPD